MFFDQFPDMLEFCSQLKGSFLILGDFNIHFNRADSPATISCPLAYTLSWPHSWLEHILPEWWSSPINHCFSLVDAGPYFCHVHTAFQSSRRPTSVQVNMQPKSHWSWGIQRRDGELCFTIATIDSTHWVSEVSVTQVCPSNMKECAVTQIHALVRFSVWTTFGFETPEMQSQKAMAQVWPDSRQTNLLHGDWSNKLPSSCIRQRRSTTAPKSVLVQHAKISSWTSTHFSEKLNHQPFQLPKQKNSLVSFQISSRARSSLFTKTLTVLLCHPHQLSQENI